MVVIYIYIYIVSYRLILCILYFLSCHSYGNIICVMNEKELYVCIYIRDCKFFQQTN